MQSAGLDRADITIGPLQLSQCSCPAGWGFRLEAAAADGLADLLPALSERRPSGSFAVEGIYDHRGKTVRWLTLDAEKLDVCILGRDVQLDGSLRLEGMPLPAPLPAAVRTERLWVAVGNTKGFITADVTNLAGGPMGHVALLAESIDEPELTAWARTVLEPPQEASPVQIAATAPCPADAGVADGATR